MKYILMKESDVKNVGTLQQLFQVLCSIQKLKRLLHEWNEVKMFVCYYFDIHLLKED